MSTEQNNKHVTVLLKEAVSCLSIDPNAIYFDGTFGRGGHSEKILNQLSKGLLIATDKDPDAISIAKELQAKNNGRFAIVHDSFSNIKKIASDYNVYGQINGILLDLGVSSPQFDQGERGFSFINDGPLDMRMDTTRGEPASKWLQGVKEIELARILKNYGDEKYAKRIAKAIAIKREKQAFTTTKELASVIAEAHPNWDKHKHPATKSFQAIRIHINNELDDLRKLLDDALDVLAAGGRLVVISFHSLEDRIVKQFMRNQAKGDDFPPGLPIPYTELNPKLKVIGKAVYPSKEELEVNIRSRSAVMRTAEKL
ncbi:MAG: 16S rRNA (cytosine(1402)-N(4))-methyltransferase RsmH [Pseudomonadota bacterium]